MHVVKSPQLHCCRTSLQEHNTIHLSPVGTPLPGFPFRNSATLSIPVRVSKRVCAGISPGQCSANLSSHQITWTAGLRLKAGPCPEFPIQLVWVGPKNLHFQQVPLRCWEPNLEALLQDEDLRGELLGQRAHASLTLPDNPKVTVPIYTPICCVAFQLFPTPPDSHILHRCQAVYETICHFGPNLPSSDY